MPSIDKTKKKCHLIVHEKMNSLILSYMVNMKGIRIIKNITDQNINYYREQPSEMYNGML